MSDMFNDGHTRVACIHRSLDNYSYTRLSI